MAVRTMIRALVSRAAPANEAAVEGFDAVFYREAYPDLAQLGDAALERHYRQHGAAEGRQPSREAALAALAKEGLAPPEDFDPDDYLARNPDLAAGLPSRWAAVEHYLRHGRREQRSYGELDTELYGDLYFPGENRSAAELRQDYEQVGRAAGRARSSKALAQSLGLPGHGGWLKALRPREFAQLNWNWAGEASTLPKAIDAMLREGFERIAPIAYDRPFQVAYWREVSSLPAEASNAEVYRNWLFRGLDAGAPGTEIQRLTQHALPLDGYPDEFDWRAYARNTRSGASRWNALAALTVDDQTRAADIPLTGRGDAAAFLAAAGRAAAHRSRARSVELLTHAQTLGPINRASRIAFADGLRELGRHEEAFEIYSELVGGGQAEISTVIHAAHAGRAAGKFDATLDLLDAARDLVSGHPLFRSLTIESVEAWFAHHSQAIRDSYAAGTRSEADAANVVLAQAAAERLMTLDPVGAPVRATPDGRVVMLANTDLRQCTHYRVEQKVELFAAAGRPADVFPAGELDAFLSALPGATAAIFYRTAGLPQTLRAIEYARRLGVPTYYEIDDLIFSDDYPDPIESYGGAISQETYNGLLWGTPLFRLAMSRCDYGIASTTALAGHMRSVVRTGEVFVLPNALDHRNADFVAGAPRVRDDGDVVLFYGSGTKAHNTDFLELAGPAIAEIMAARADVRLVIVGYLTLDARLEAFRDRIVSAPFIQDARGFWSLHAEADINLAVLAPGPVTDAKSEIKWLEAATLGIPTIVSDTHRYREVVEDGIDGVLARDAESWRAALVRLIDDPALRRRMGARAKEKALANYGIRASVARLNALLAPADARAEQARRVDIAGNGRPRVLLVNAFFPPQTIGGATRVVRDNLADFLASDAAFDFAVASTDHEAHDAYAVRVDAHEGCPVFRVASPEAVNMDWNPRDPLLGDIFTGWLDSWTPELVHFHAVQRWTASAVEACVRAGIPYVVTVHDAWWVSDHQFLVDDRGELHDAGESMPTRPPAPATLGDSLARRRYLTALLGGARRVIGVSQTFADLYRRCGFDRVVAIPNGTAQSPRLPRRPSPHGRVRLAHVGGISGHKGYHLLQAALRQGRYERLEVTVVDHSRFGGDVRHEFWGATRVNVVGKTPADGMPAFYAGQDVLLAPSTWPESYGLVAREALNAGLWVVAGDRGAMGEDVRPGVNGFVVDVSNPGGLAKALTEIDADPERYLASPPATPLRPAVQQSRELLALYAEVLAEPASEVGPIPAWAGENRRPVDAPDTLAVRRTRRMRARWGRSATAGAPLD